MPKVNYFLALKPVYKTKPCPSRSGINKVWKGIVSLTDLSDLKIKCFKVGIK